MDASSAATVALRGFLPSQGPATLLLPSATTPNTLVSEGRDNLESLLAPSAGGTGSGLGIESEVKLLPYLCLPPLRSIPPFGTLGPSLLGDLGDWGT